MKLKKNEKRKSESGAIMLEVVAVLSLMGLMGTVLYRQIYQRNQELHNIQMASEIRIVKEAFSAWIHANTAPLYTMCNMSAIGADEVSSCQNAPLPDILEEIKTSYLPDGYFFEPVGPEGAQADYLANNYDFHLFGYWRGTGSATIPTYYGVVVPKPGEMLPDGGENEDTWNFRRAARVAMLIGIDGGAYDQSITGCEIVGSVGTWNLLAQGILFKSCDAPSKIPTYVAMTGLDVFQPEVELPRIEVGLPKEDDWSMAFKELNAYGLFTVGQDEHCFTMGDRRAVEKEGVFELDSDTIYAPGTNNCQPAFWVTTEKDSATNKEIGHVYVLNDLHVGADPSGAAESAIQLKKEGEIVLSDIQLKKEGAIVVNQTAQDPQNGNKATNYLLDPAYTSVMNDVKLMSRGGAKLSEILPNYILKEVKRGKGSVTVEDLSEEYCPKGYDVGIRANPISWSDKEIDTTTITAGSTDSVEIEGYPDSQHTHNLSGTVTLSDKLAKAKERVVLFSDSDKCKPEDDAQDEYDDVDGKFGVRLNDKTKKTACIGWRDKGSTDEDDFEVDTGAVLEVSVYCIWKGSTASSERAEDSGFSPDETYCNSFKAPGTCTLMGCQWDGDDDDGNCTKK